MNTSSDELHAELTRLQQENQRLREQLQAALDGTNLCIWQGEPQTGQLTVFNLQDFAPHEIAPHFKQWLAKLHPEDKTATLASYHNHLAGLTPYYEAEYRTVSPSGKISWIWDRGRVLERDAAGQPLRIMGSHIDITRRKEYEQQLAQLAHFDPLTGLANRRQMMERLKQESERATRHGQGFVLAMLDVDHFKQFNDNHGHDVGDCILAEVARAMENELREYDICGRWGGEEFLLMLPETSLEIAQAVIDRVHHSIRQRSVKLGDQQLSITTSIGVAEYRYGEHFAEMLRRADSAMLEAKRNGRDRVLYA